MGDSLEANWEGADLLDCYDKPDVGSNDSDDELEGEPLPAAVAAAAGGTEDSSESTEKQIKKRKFEALKEKKAAKLSGSKTSASANSSIIQSYKQLSVEEIMMELSKHRPKNLKLPEFHEEDFFDVVAPENPSKTKKVRTLHLL